MVLRIARLAVAMIGVTLASWVAHADQDGLVPGTEVHGPALQFDWPDLQVGIGAYEEGPTGLTIIRFMHRAGVVVDSRGGSPGTVNTDSLRLGYDAFGSVVDRQGNMASCHPAPKGLSRNNRYSLDALSAAPNEFSTALWIVYSGSNPNWGGLPKIMDLMTHVPLSRRPDWQPTPEPDVPTHRNTTVSLIVTNDKLGFAQLQRLAIQVHTSMARAIQPYS